MNVQGEFMMIIMIGNARSKCFFGHNVIEIFTTDFPTISRGSLQHFLQFWDIHGFSELLGHPSDVVNVDVATSIIIKQIEDTVNSISALFISKFGGDGIQELLEINLAPFTFKIGDHIEYCGVFSLESKTLHSRFEFPRINLVMYLGSILPVASVSNKLKASLSSSTSS